MGLKNTERRRAAEKTSKRRLQNERKNLNFKIHSSGVLGCSMLADSCLLPVWQTAFQLLMCTQGAAYLWGWLEAWSTAGWRGWVSDSFLAEDSTLPLPEPGGRRERDHKSVSERSSEAGATPGSSTIYKLYVCAFKCKSVLCWRGLPDDVQGVRAQLSSGTHLALTVSWDTPSGRTISVLTHANTHYVKIVKKYKN